MAVVTKVKSRLKLTPRVDPKVDPKLELIADEKAVEADSTGAVVKRSKKHCQFCMKKQSPIYTDSVLLRKFISDRGRIHPRTRTGVCAKHQRVLAKHIKYSRHLGLLPFRISV